MGDETDVTPTAVSDRERLELAAQAAFAAFGHDVATPMPWDQAPEDFRITFRMVADAVLMAAAAPTNPASCMVCGHWKSGWEAALAREVTARADLATARDELADEKRHGRKQYANWQSAERDLATAREQRADLQKALGYLVAVYGYINTDPDAMSLGQWKAWADARATLAAVPDSKGEGT